MIALTGDHGLSHSDAHLPASLAPWLDRPDEGCSCGRIHQVPITRLGVGPGLIDAVPDYLPRPAAGGDLLLLADPDTWQAAGEKVARTLRAAGHRLFEQVLPAAPRADDVTLADLLRTLPCTPGWIIAVGSGTIGDLGKLLADRTGAQLCTVATAASMNGYASSIAAFTRRGLKITLPMAPPRVIVVDTQVLAAAPSRLGAAGFGDLLSKPLSGADWKLSHLLLGEAICPTALQVADDAVRRARRDAAGIASGEPAAYGTLIEALLLSGISMSIAGASSPASGGEHLLSHYLDISAEGWARPPRLHGEQVAVGTLVCARLYAFLRAAGPPAGPPPSEEDDDALRILHAHLPAEALEALLAEARAARQQKPDRMARLTRLQEGWERIWHTVDEQLGDAAGLERDLATAGCPTRFSQIDVDPSLAGQLLRRARHMRRRYTVLDLAADLGRLDAFIAERAWDADA